MTYIITGASGFIGFNLAMYLLENSHRVIALVSEKSNIERINTLKGIEMVYFGKEVSDSIENLKDSRADCFIHSAWKGVSGAGRNDINQFYENIPFALQTLKIASGINCGQWIGLGSQAEYGIVNKKITEDSPANPLTPYACAKSLVYECVKQLASFTEMKLSWLRIFSLYGPYDNSVNFIPYLISTFKNNTNPTISSCEQDWDYLYIDDAVKAIYKISEMKAVGLYNLGSGRTTKLKYVVEEIKKQMDITDETAYGNKEETVPLFHLEADINKIQNATDWQPVTTLEEGLSKTIKFYTK